MDAQDIYLAKGYTLEDMNNLKMDDFKTYNLKEKQEFIDKTLLKFPSLLGKEILAVCENELDYAFEKIVHYLLNY